MSDAPALRVPSGARWDCHSCGACCRLYDLGPVEPDVIHGLQAQDIASHWPPAAEGPWFEERRSPEPGGGVAYFLAHRDGHCVFLRDDNRCAVHAILGSAAKPGFCREFPFHTVEDPAGIAVIVRPGCAGYHASRKDGASVADQAAEAVALPRVAARRRFFPEQVVLLPDAAVSLQTWMSVEARWLSRLDEKLLAPEALVADLRSDLAGLTKRSFPPADPARALGAARAAVEAVRRVVAQAADSSDADPYRQRFTREAAAMLGAATAGMGDLRPLSADAADYLRLLLKTWLLGKSFASLGAVTEGLGAFLLPVFIIRATKGKSEASRSLITAAEASDAVVRWTKLIDNRAIVGVLRLARPALHDLFLHAGSAPPDDLQDLPHA